MPYADVGLLSPVWVGTVAEALTSDHEVVAAMVAVEAALLHALAEHGLAPPVTVPPVLLDPRVLAERAVAPGNPTVPLVAALRDALPAEGTGAGWVHHGATSQDLVDSALMLVATAVLTELAHDLEALAVRLAALADEHRARPCVARTLTQQALPTTLGLRLAGWLSGVHDALELVRGCLPLPVSLAGPVGSAAAYGAAGPAVLSSVAGTLGLAEPVLSWHTRRTPVLRLATALVAAGEACGRIAADLLLMSQTEVGEADDGSGGASSAMPHKANPTRSVLVASAARQLPGLLATVAGSGAGASERPPGDWHAEWQPLRTMLRLAGSAAARTVETAGVVRFHPDALAAQPRPAHDLPGRGRALGRRGDRPRGPVDRPGAGPARGDDRMSVSLAHRVEGPSDAPTVLLLPSLGTTGDMWDALAADLAPQHRVVRPDTRGHGGSPVPPGPYTVAELAQDVLALADDLGADRFAVVGLSLGGAIGQTLAWTAPERLTSLVLCCTVPVFGEASTWTERAALVRAEGMQVLDEPTRGRWFTDGLPGPAPRGGRAARGPAHRHGPRGLRGLLRGAGRVRRPRPARRVHRADPRGGRGRGPGGHPAACAAMAEAIPGADLVVLEGASHIASAARPEAFAAAVAEHLGRQR